MLLLDFYKEAIRRIHPLCFPRSTPTCLMMLSHSPDPKDYSP